MVTMEGSTLRFYPEGELTIYQVEETLKELKGFLPEAKEVVIDFTVTDKMDTAGFQLFVSLTKSTKASGQECCVDGVGGSVENFMALFGYEWDAQCKGEL